MNFLCVKNSLAFISNGKNGTSDWILFVFCGTVIFLSASTITLMTPFYSLEAETRGGSVQLHGFVFGIYQLVMLTTAPILGKYMGWIGPVRMFQISSILFTGGLLGFGFLEMITSKMGFVYLSFLFRIVQAAACTGIFSACFVIISVQSTENAGTMFAALQTFVALGLAFGPIFGDAFYTLGGFHLPFFVFGGLVIGARILSEFTFQNVKFPDVKDELIGLENVVKFLKIPTIVLAGLGMISTSMTLGFICTTLETQLRQFSLSTMSTGLILAINGVIFALCAPAWGYLCDNIIPPVLVNFSGNVLTFGAFLLIGPAPFLPLDESLFLTIVGLIIQGIGFGASHISAFCVALQDCTKHGFPNNMPTYALVSAIWQSVLSFGVWLGSSVSGVLVEDFGFRESCWLFLITSFTMAVILGVYLFTGFTISSFSSSTKLYSCKPDKSEILRFVKKDNLVSTYGVVNLHNNLVQEDNLSSL